jgi:hypothetical protein
MHCQVDSFLQTLFLPNLASFLAKHREGIQRGESGSATVNSARAKCAVTEKGHYYGIASIRAPGAFGLSQCGHLQHWTWPKATKSTLNPSASAN